MSKNSVGARARYDKAFYDEFTNSSRRSAEIVLGKLFEQHRPSSVVDVGCGVGAWLSIAQELGAQVRGFDGPWVDDSQLLIAPSDFTRINFESREWPDLGQADLAMSLEVAEHLSEEQGRLLVRKLCTCAPAILFSAAVPMQGGEGHQNEQWQSWWANLFREQKYTASVTLRNAIWADEAVNFWYRQNCVFYFDPQRLPHLAQLTDAKEPMDVIHPRLFDIRVIKRARHSRLRRVLDALRMR